MFTIRYWQKELEFEYPFTIAKGTKTHQPTFIVELNWRGIKAYGEAPAISYYNISTDKMKSDLEQKRKFIESFSFTDPKRFWHFLHHLFPENPFLVCSLDMAGWDLYGKIRNQPLFKLWNLNNSATPQTDYTIGIDNLEKMLDKIKGHPAPIYKVKLGAKHDLDILSSLKSATNAAIRVDANAGWTYEHALEMMDAMEKLNVECIEQPLPVSNTKEMVELKKRSKIPLIADESCVSVNDIDACIHAFHGINIKLTKCSGITPAFEMIKKARANNLKVMLGCMNESTIGTAALVHLSPMADYLDADGPLLLKEDVASGLLLSNHSWQIPTAPGLGIRPNELL